MEENKIRKCLICCSDQNQAKEMFNIRGYSIRQCTICRFVYLGVQLEWQDKELLNEQKYGDSRDGIQTRYMVRENNLALNQISKYAQCGNLLEIGCGDGGFLALAKSKGWNVKGVELSRGAARAAVLQLSEKEIHCGTMHDCPFHPESFDVVVMKSVVEHLPDPRAELAVAYRLLKPDGYLFILTPNIESLEANLYGRHWFALVPADHLWFFSPSTISCLLEARGFRRRWLTTTESYEDVVVGLLFALRSQLSELLNTFGQRNRAGAASNSASHTLVSGLSSTAKDTYWRLLEASRYLNFPWFFVYSSLLERTSLGACIRGIFQKTLLDRDRAEI